MYAAKRRQKSVERKFQFGKLGIGHKFQLFNDLFGQFPQGSFIGRQVTLHQAQLLHQTQSGAGIVEHHQRQFFAIKVHEYLSLSGTQQGCTPGHRISLLRQPVKPAFPAWKGGCSAPVLRLRRLCP